ncbi:hypothetical protein O6H91_19G079800 [Diphasiastrum complanatum]|uniref:Uncharacterized protein n=1 Tax=Diphasiastrum complanatum TaxID=34168 RepID=A0ACC2AWW8_DIPCM|nr:hypothetical protein O6H91_19G079800 [Diphasiastrum complanatum]
MTAVVAIILASCFWALLIHTIGSISLVDGNVVLNSAETRTSNHQQWLDYIKATSDMMPWNKSLPAKFTQPTPQKKEVVISDHGLHGEKTLVVDQNDRGCFSSIQAAVDSVRNWSESRTVILIRKGIYREKVLIPKEKERITFLGEPGSTVIQWNSTASDLGSDGLPLRTYHSATVAVNARYFVAKYITFKNTAGAAWPGQRGRQAVALRISADYAAFYSCLFLGYQDTLYDHRGRHYFKNCYIVGAVDFIFGNGRSLYQNCRLYAWPMGTTGSLTAQKRNDTSLNTGFAFVSCVVGGSGSVYLGRAWGNNSRVVFALTWMDRIIAPGGWNDWGIPARERSVYYALYKCSGPGSIVNRKVGWSTELTLQEAWPFLSIGFINGMDWLEEI